MLPVAVGLVLLSLVLGLFGLRQAGSMQAKADSLYRLLQQTRLDPSGSWLTPDSGTGRPPAPWDDQHEGTGTPGPDAPATPGNTAARPTLLLFGDSHIERWPADLLPEGWNVRRLGKAGDTTALMALRLERETGDAAAQGLGSVAADSGTPARTTIMIGGTNDLRAIGALPAREEEITQQAGDRLTEMASRLAHPPGSTVLLLSVPPFGPVDRSLRHLWSEASRTAVRTLNQRLDRFARSHPRVEFLNANGVLGRAGFLREEFAADWLHLNREGYEHLARLVAERVAAPIARATGTARPALERTLDSRAHPHTTGSHPD